MRKGYDPSISMQMALDKVQEILDFATAKQNVPVSEAAFDIQAVQMWVAIAQVHATNAQTEIMKKVYHCKNICCQ